jgi:hypothetical protein
MRQWLVGHSANGTEIQTDDLRELVDGNGILRAGALAGPSPAGSLLVFSQRADACIELASWQRHAEDFFGAGLGLTLDKRYPEAFPAVDAALVVLAPREGSPDGIRLCYGRPRTDDDLRAAEDADDRAGNNGLGLLARRCRSVWLVVRRGEGDRTALLLAAIVASVVLGPILSPEGDLFGVKTARARLERLVAS